MRVVQSLFLNPFLQLADHLGSRITAGVSYSWELFLVLYISFRATLLQQSQSFRTIFGVVAAQIYFTGYQALPLITMLAFGSGTVVLMQSTSQFSFLGGSDLMGQLVVGILMREVGPLLTALIVIARSGTAVASELGNMKCNREIDALEVMGINPMSFIVFPRLLGGIVSVVCLAIYFVLVSIFGGMLIAKAVMGLPVGYYLDSLARAFTYQDVFMFLLKNIFSGAIIFVVCCHQGFQVKQGPHEVPQVTTKAVVNSIIYVICFNIFATVLFYLDQLSRMGVIRK
jgi:phospholipid/cholesterol/gamma-HCH transport system permease protein